MNLAFSQPKANQVARKCSVSNSNDRLHPNPMTKEPKKSDHNQNVLTTSNSAVGKRKTESTAGDKRDIEGETEAQEPPNKKQKSNNFIIKNPPHVNINQAIVLQTQTNNLLRHMISQNDKQIELLNRLLEK